MSSTYTSNDPLLSDQWHHRQIRLDKLNGEYRGAGVSVGIWDDGVETTHADLSANYDASKEYTVGGTRLSPHGASGSQSHGTAVSGIIAAVANNGSGGAGIASSAKITGVDILGGGSAYSHLATSTAWMGQFHVVNNSWGWTGRFADSPASAFGATFHGGLKSSADTGRGGLGTIIVNSAANDGESFTDSNYSGFNQSRYTITVGAIHQSGDVASYSNRGASVLVSGSAGVVTTDETGSAGYGWGDTTSSFAGTSAAGPVVAGVTALMLEASGNRLGWRDVQTILATTADQTSGSLFGGASGQMRFGWSINGARNVDGGGMHVSNDVGYGLVDAYEAVRYAEAWALFGAAQTSANEQVATASGTLNRSLADNGVTEFTVAVGTNVVLEHADLTLTLTHADVTELRVELIAPDGTASTVLSPMAGDDIAKTNWTWTFGSEALRGSSSAGVWTVRITDTSAGRTGSIAGYRLDAYGSAPSASDVYHYTNEFTEMLALSASRAILADDDGGTDWINLAGQSAAVTVSLAGRTVHWGGVQRVAIAAGTTIENVVAGDGADSLTGDGGANHLVGMRGHDTLTGGGGADILDGRTGIDTAAYALSTAAVLVNLATVTQSGGDAEGDSLISIENVIGSAHADTLSGNAGANRLTGGGGDDVIDGRAGTDTVVFSGAFRDYAIGKATGGDGVVVYTVVGTGAAAGDGTDTVRNVEVFRFADGQLAADRLLDGTAPSPVADDPADGGGDDGGSDSLPATVRNGTARAETLVGVALLDELYGLAGNDRLMGSAGADKLDGGAGIDTVDYSASGAGVDVDLARGSQSGGFADGDTVIAVENVTGSAHADTLAGTAGVNAITAGGGDDIIKGDAGADKIAGDAGVDTIDYAASTAAVRVDLAKAAQTGGFAQGDKLTGIENAIGSAFGDVLTGNAAANTLTGGAGDDRLTGAGGGDNLVGGDGHDTADYTRSGAGVVVNLSSGLGSGGDAAGDVLSGIEAIVGSGRNDALTGDANANVLTGGAGNDTLAGLAGADRLDGGKGIDTADYTATSVGVTVDLAAGTGSGGDAAGDILVGIENVTGSGHADRLVGSALANVLVGGAGDDILAGRGGADRLFGGDGIDTADYSASAAGVDVDLSRTTAQKNGDAKGDVLASIENVIGSGAADILAGDTADNMFTGGSGSDLFRFAANFGSDTITDFVAGLDRISFKGLGLGFGSLTFATSGSDQVIGVAGTDDTIRLTGANALVLSSSDFVFA
ncbi:S8 family serine peptidase [Chthonobacter rhizosphaerae]|uniref:S8 family serine peptidase n=1 Tax=Chthonobacter rhizosphaerae TaxID=2735553 RepID=UPI002483C096|nr:S8 family serine peptidase [Chthonobacter rhizosphaerae]